MTTTPSQSTPETASLSDAQAPSTTPQAPQAESGFGSHQRPRDLRLPTRAATRSPCAAA